MPGEDMIDDIQRMTDDAGALLEAKLRMRQTESQANVTRSKYNSLRHWYSPDNGDQWPWAKRLNPNKIHLTVNILQPAVDIDSRLQSLLPRLVCVPPSQDDKTKKRAEATEKLILEALEQSGWDVWFNDSAKVRALLGKVAWKVLWNNKDDRPDVSVIETPENLRIGWGSSDYTVMDWALYEYSISPMEAKREYGVTVQRRRDGEWEVRLPAAGATKHDDPLGQMPSTSQGDSSLTSGKPEDGYMDAHVQVWDYWYKRGSAIWNCIIVGNSVNREVVQRTEQSHLPDIPYIVIENSHKPASPDGISTIENLTDLQEEYNRLLSHWLQLIADNTDPAWQAIGEGSDNISPGTIPKAGQIIGLGAGIEVHPIEKPTNQVPLEQSIGALWDAFYKVSGLPEIVFGQMPGAQTSGRAMAVQVEATNNRGDPKRRRLYRGLRELVLFWLEMIERKDWQLPVQAQPAADVPPEQMALGLQEPEPVAPTIGLRAVVKGLRKWKIVAPEVTPRDVIDHVTTQTAILNARGQSLESYMDQIGIDNPLEEIEKIIRERSNAALFPGDVQAQVAAAATLLQMRIQMAQMQQQMAALGGSPVDMANQSQGAGFLQSQEFAAQPPGTQEQGGESAGLPPTGAGPGQPGTQPGLGTMQSLIRGQPSGQAQALQQTTIKRQV